MVTPGDFGSSQFQPVLRKGFTGAAVLYLPRSFLNGGLMLGVATLVPWFGWARGGWLVGVAMAYQEKAMGQY